ncbi:Uncharacterised protein [Klebsiella pneumoniae]|uniref:Uncharacterized protein n=2 Tax=Klebsiella pneumoniae TaxID=573 RepID=A0A377V0C0_KLEPN|nr:Uncharacterised protein [Klebsiella pneumoniae]
MTYVKEIDDPLGTGKQKAISFFREIQHAVFLGSGKGTIDSQITVW